MKERVFSQSSFDLVFDLQLWSLSLLGRCWASCLWTSPVANGSWGGGVEPLWHGLLWPHEWPLPCLSPGVIISMFLHSLCWQQSSHNSNWHHGTCHLFLGIWCLSSIIILLEIVSLCARCVIRIFGSLGSLSRAGSVSFTTYAFCWIPCTGMFCKIRFCLTNTLCAN